MLGEALVQHFRKRLAEAMSWCAFRLERADDEYRLRTESIFSGYHTWLPFWHDSRNDFLHDVRRANYEVEKLCERRLAALEQHHVAILDPAKIDESTVLLSYHPSYATGDELAWGESIGVFNGCDEPGWDGWVCMTVTRGGTCKGSKRDDPPRMGNDHLIAWVPEPLRALAEAGVNVSPVDSLTWTTVGHITEMLFAQSTDLM